MKKLLILLICAFMLTAIPVQASNSGFSGLCTVLLKEDAMPSDAVLSADDANKITYKLLGDKPFTKDNAINFELVEYLASRLQPNTDVVLSYNDMGLIPLKYRSSYTTLESYGKLYSENRYLLPAKDTTYDFFVNSMFGFKNDILNHNSLYMYEGTVTEVYLEDGYTHICLSSKYGTQVIRSKDISKVTVFKNGTLAPYSRNIGRGDTMRIYTKADEPVYMEEILPENTKDVYINPMYTMYKADIYYLEGNILITRNVHLYQNGTFTPVNTRYSEFNVNEKTYIKENFLAVSKTSINQGLLDKTAYIICDSYKNALYINVCK